MSLEKCIWCDTKIFFDETYPVNGAWLDVRDEDWFCSMAAREGVSGHQVWDERQA